MVNWEARDYAGETLIEAIIRRVVVGIVVSVICWIVTRDPFLVLIWGGVWAGFGSLIEFARPRN